MAFTTDAFATKVRRIADVANARASASDIFEAADEMISARLVPLLMDIREEYNVTYLDRTMVVGQATYRVPPRAVAGGLRKLAVLDANGRERPPLQELSVEDRYYAEQAGNGEPTEYLLSGDLVTLFPSPSQALTLRMYYVRRPSKMVPLASAGVIDDVEQDAGVMLVNVVSVPAGFPSGDGFGYFDIVQGAPNFDLWLTNALGLRGDGTPTPDTTFRIEHIADSEMVDIVTVQDATSAQKTYLTLADETPIIPLPAEAHASLAHLTAALVLETIGDKDSAAMKYELAGHMLERLVAALDPRNQEGSKRIVPRYGVFDVW